MGVPRTPTYGKTWKTKRQTRIKPSGMTKLLEKYDTLWKNYDPQVFIRDVMGTGDNGLRDIQRSIDGFKKAESEISELEKANAGIYNKAEKEVLKKVLADIGEEITFWKDKKKAFALEEGGAEVAEARLKKIAGAIDAAMVAAETRAGQLSSLHAKLSAADKYDDRRHPPAAIETFRKSADGLETMLREIEDAERKFDAAADKVRKAYPKDAGLITAIGKLEAACLAHHKRVKDLRRDRDAWLLWAGKELAASPV